MTRLSFLENSNPPIIHRDIKPGNVKITPSGQIYLVDFGLAKLIQNGQATTTGARAMTPGYSPPEQYGTARTDNRSDLFSLGATLYAALTGAIPEDALARAMDQAVLTAIRKHNPRVSRRLAAVIEKSLAIRPDERYQNAEEFKQALLNVRGFTRRKTGEYVVSPAPGNGSNVNQELFPDTPAPKPLSPGYSPPPPNKSPLPIPTSSPISEPSSNQYSRQRKRSMRVWILVGLLLIFLVAAGAVLNDPNLPGQALALVIPSQTTELPGVIIEPSPTPSKDTLPVQVAIPTKTLSPVTPVATQTPHATPTKALTSVPVIPPPPSATPAPTVIGGGNGQIAFASTRSGTTQVWVVNVDGTNSHQLTDMPEGACQPDWSPDGMSLVFISPCKKNEDQYRSVGMFIINADGTGLTPLPSAPGGDFDPVWSPDGTKIAFSSLRNSGRPRIYSMTLSDGSVERLSDQYSYDRQPYWSPDGSKLAFVTTQKGPVQIWTMNPDGSNQELFSRSADAINLHPVWSHDGEVIVFTQISQQRRTPALVAASYMDGNYSEFRYDQGPAPAKEAKYSPDGLWLVYESWPEGSNHDIYIMSASGAGRIRLTDAPGDDFDPVWRPVITQP